MIFIDFNLHFCVSLTMNDGGVKTFQVRLVIYRVSGIALCALHKKLIPLDSGHHYLRIRLIVFKGGSMWL